MKKKFLKACKGSISIFLSILLTGVCSFSALMMEAGRYSVADQALDEATITSAMSALADYNSTLQKRFGLYGIESKNGKGGLADKYMKLNSDSDSSGLSSLYKILNNDSKWKYDLGNYSVLERQMLEYEKYRAPMEISEDLINIDKIIKDFKKQIDKLMPKLKSLLDVIDASCDLLDAFKEIYTLYKTIQQLQASIFNGKGGFKNKVNEKFGKGWGAVEEFFSGKKWGIADPSYYKSYRALEDAISNKITYMNAHSPAPQKPSGSRPTVDESNQTNGDLLYAYYVVLKYMYDSDYFDKKGIVDSSSDIKDLFKDNNFKKVKSKLSFINKTMTRSELTNTMSTKLVELGFGSIDENTEKSELKSVYNSVYNSSNNYKSNYSNQKSAQSEWDKKNKEYNEYQEKIKEYNKKIDDANTNLKNALSIISSELGSYKGSIDKTKTAITKATSAVKKMSKSIESFGDKGDWSEEDISEVNDLFEVLMKLLTTSTINKANEGMEFIAKQKTALSSLTGESVDQNYGSLSSHANLGKGKIEYESNGYYMNKTEITGLMGTIGALSICKNMNSQLITVVKSFKELIQAFSVIPALFNPLYNTKLDSKTANILPSVVGTNSEKDSEEDIASISQYLKDARSMLGSIYEDDIGLVDPDNVSDSDVLNEELMERIARIADTMQKLSGKQDSILNDTTLLTVLVRMVANAPKIIQLVKDVIFVASHFKEFFSMFPKHLGESVLLNQYAVTKFSNRLEKVSGQQGANVLETPQADAQTFKQANLEYIVNGGKSEIVNQEACFERIFALRLLNNAVLIATDKDWMEIIGACNIAAPIVFIVLLYIESNIDMNLLIKLGMEIPLIKTKLVLALDHITEITEEFSQMVEIKEVNYEDDDYIYSYYSEKTETKYTYTYKEWKELELEGKIDETLKTMGEDASVVLDKNASALSKYYATKEVSQTTKKLLEGLEEGMFKMDYKTYLFLFMLFQPNRLKVKRMADLIQMELRYGQLYSKGTGPDILLSDYHTFVRVEASATLNSVLPVISLGKDGINNSGLRLKSTKYVGY